MAYIINQELPKTCGECPCLRDYSLNSRYNYQCNITLGLKKNIDRKPLWCPLIDLEDLLKSDLKKREGK